MLCVICLCYVLMFMIIKCFLFSNIINLSDSIISIINNGIIIYSTIILNTACDLEDLSFKFVDAVFLTSLPLCIN